MTVLCDTYNKLISGVRTNLSIIINLVSVSSLWDLTDPKVHKVEYYYRWAAVRRTGKDYLLSKRSLFKRQTKKAQQHLKLKVKLL